MDMEMLACDRSLQCCCQEMVIIDPRGRLDTLWVASQRGLRWTVMTSECTCALSYHNQISHCRAQCYGLGYVGVTS